MGEGRCWKELKFPPYGGPKQLVPPTPIPPSYSPGPAMPGTCIRPLPQERQQQGGACHPLPPALPARPPPAPTDDSLNPARGRTHAKLSAVAGPGEGGTTTGPQPEPGHDHAWQGYGQHGDLGGDVQGALVLQIAHQDNEGD